MELTTLLSVAFQSGNMNNFCFILASVSTRQHLLNAFIDTAKKSKYKDADFYLFYQQISDDGISFDESFFKKVFKCEERMGVCYPRMFLLSAVEGYDYYIIVDDDIEFLGKEDYDTMMSFAEKMEDCGLICGEYKARRKLYEDAVPGDNIYEKNIQFIEGGAVIKKSIRDLLLKEIPLRKLSYDGFCITTYINGYTNYKYDGSIVLHKLTNGKQGFVYVAKHSDEFESMFESYIKQTHYDDGYLKLPKKVSDLTDEAIELHERNRVY